MTKRAKPPKPAAPALREPSARERRTIAAAQAKQAARPARVAFKVKHSDGRLILGPTHDDGEGMQAHLEETFGTVSRDFTDMVLMRVANVIAQEPAVVSEAEINGALALLGGIEPANELEAVIAGQIIGADALAMEFMRRARRADTLQKAEAYTNMATKTSRTMAAHIEALSRLRTGGKQQVVVKHVYVQGNAVVGDGAQAVMQYGGTGGHIGKGQQAQTFSGADALGPEVWGQDPLWDALPSASGQGAQALPDARMRAGLGSAEGRAERELSPRPENPGNAGVAP